MWATPYIGKAVALGVITGDPNGFFNAHDNATRAEAAVIFCRFLSLLDTYYESNYTSNYYGTTIPDYTSVTSVPIKNYIYSEEDGIHLFCYEHVQFGEYSEIINYMEYLELV